MGLAATLPMVRRGVRQVRPHPKEYRGISPAVKHESTDHFGVTAPKVLRIFSLDLTDRCELQIGWRSPQSVLVVLTDGNHRFQGEMGGGTSSLWGVVNGGKAAARSGRVLIGLAREGNEIDVVAIQRGVGVSLASRFSTAAFSGLLENLDLPLRATLAEAGAAAGNSQHG